MFALAICLLGSAKAKAADKNIRASARIGLQVGRVSKMFFLGRSAMALLGARIRLVIFVSSQFVAA
jgi:hypothetical protein